MIHVIFYFIIMLHFLVDRPLLENDHIEEVSDEIYDKVKSDEVIIIIISNTHTQCSICND